MKRFLIAATAILLLAACSANKKNVTTVEKDNGKALLIDGNWEVDYIMPQGKSFDELYARAKPTFTFDSKEGKVSGVTGCNNFTGTFSTEGKKISFGENMAVTRKMCPDMTGEQAFLATIKKVNSYSVTNAGKTLNLIMGDMAIMRAQRK